MYITFIDAAFDLASIGADTQFTCSSETPKSCAQQRYVLKFEGIYKTMCAMYMCCKECMYSDLIMCMV